MPVPCQILLLWVLFASLVSMILTVSDKRAARRGAWRVRERALFLWAALGGSLAMFLTMRAIRHKTQHRKFMIGLPCIFLAQLCLCGLCGYISGLLPAA